MQIILLVCMKNPLRLSRVSRSGLGGKGLGSNFSSARETGKTQISFPRAKMRMLKLVYFTEPWQEVWGRPCLQGTESTWKKGVILLRGSGIYSDDANTEVKCVIVDSMASIGWALEYFARTVLLWKSFIFPLSLITKEFYSQHFPCSIDSLINFINSLVISWAFCYLFGTRDTKSGPSMADLLVDLFH